MAKAYREAVAAFDDYCSLTRGSQLSQRKLVNLWVYGDADAKNKPAPQHIQPW